MENENQIKLDRLNSLIEKYKDIELESLDTILNAEYERVIKVEYINEVGNECVEIFIFDTEFLRNCKGIKSNKKG